jgi:hypothetical protein
MHLGQQNAMDCEFGTAKERVVVVLIIEGSPNQRQKLK